MFCGHKSSDAEYDREKDLYKCACGVLFKVFWVFFFCIVLTFFWKKGVHEREEKNVPFDLKWFESMRRKREREEDEEPLFPKKSASETKQMDIERSESFKSMKEMGFEPEEIVKALEKTNNNAEQAVALIIGGNADFPSPSVARPPPMTSYTQGESNMHALAAMGTQHHLYSKGGYSSGYSDYPNTSWYKNEEEEEEEGEEAFDEIEMAADSEDLIDKYIRPKYKSLPLDSEDNTLLHLAVRSQRVNLLEAAISNGFSCSEENVSGQTPLFMLMDEWRSRYKSKLVIGEADKLMMELLLDAEKHTSEEWPDFVDFILKKYYTLIRRMRNLKKEIKHLEYRNEELEEERDEFFDIGRDLEQGDAERVWNKIREQDQRIRELERENEKLEEELQKK